MPPGRSNRRPLILASAVALAAALAGGACYFRFVEPYESTDDAAIEGHIRPVTPQVSGRVERLLVRDNQEVKKGEMLLEIDPREYDLRLSQVDASLAVAYGRLEEAAAKFAVDQAEMELARAGITVADANAVRSLAALRRYGPGGGGKWVEFPKSQIDLARFEVADAGAQAVLARDREKAAEAQADLSHTGIRTAFAEVEGSEAEARQAELNFSHTKIMAADDGWVTRRTVEEGAYVQAGQPLMAIVSPAVWVVANFKEAQLAHMRAGDPVAITVAAWPQHIFAGRVESIQAGTGVVPPKDAPEDFVKVARRVPVKILFDDADLADAGLTLGPGMSVKTEVKVR